MDRRVGNTKKMGALFGILAAIGGPIPEPETIPYAFFILSNRLSDIFKSKLVLVARHDQALVTVVVYKQS